MARPKSDDTGGIPVSTDVRKDTYPDGVPVQVPAGQVDSTTTKDAKKAPAKKGS